jgi:hypothetical protein
MRVRKIFMGVNYSIPKVGKYSKKFGRRKLKGGKSSSGLKLGLKKIPVTMASDFNPGIKRKEAIRMI